MMRDKFIQWFILNRPPSSESCWEWFMKHFEEIKKEREGTNEKADNGM